MRYQHILGRLFNVPLAIEEQKLEIIVKNVGDLLLLGESPSYLSTRTAEFGQNKHENSGIPERSIGVIPITGTLVSKIAAGESGTTSYGSIQKNISSYISKGYEILVFDLATPGGESAGLFALADYIHNLKNEGIITIGFSDCSATSAGYALLSACDTCFISDTARTGSIGVIANLVNYSKVNEENGIQHLTIRSKEKKALYNPNETFTEEAINSVKKDVMLLDSIFNERVTNYRNNLSINDVLETKGDSFIGIEAKTKGLVDDIVPNLQTILNNTLDFTRNNQTYINREATMTLEEALKLNTKLEHENEILKAKLDESPKFDESKVIAEERQRCLGILQACDTLNVSMNLAVKRIEKGSSVEDTLELFETIAEATGKTTADLQTPVQSTAEIQMTDSEKIVQLEGHAVSIDKILKSVGK